MVVVMVVVDKLGTLHFLGDKIKTHTWGGRNTRLWCDAIVILEHIEWHS